jgi:hypothetical protein
MELYSREYREKKIFQQMKKNIFTASQGLAVKGRKEKYFQGSQGLV